MRIDLQLSCKDCLASFSRSTKQQQGTIQVLFSTGPVPSGSFFVFNRLIFQFRGFLDEKAVLVTSAVLA